MRTGIGRRIKAWRVDRGLTQLQAARGAGISQAEWQKLESEQIKRIGLNMARRIVAYTGGLVAIEDLDVRGRLPAPASSTDLIADLNHRQAG